MKRLAPAVYEVGPHQVFVDITELLQLLHIEPTLAARARLARDVIDYCATTVPDLARCPLRRDRRRHMRHRRSA